MRNRKKLYIVQLIYCLLFLNIAGCKKAIDVGDPVTKLSSSTIFTSNSSAQAGVAGIFSSFAKTSNGMFNGGSSVSLLQGQAADELVSNSTLNAQFYTNSFSSQYDYYWTEIYLEMFQINSAIVRLTASTTLTPAVHDQLLGEVKFARAFIYFYAVNLYGDVPMPLGTDYVQNNKLARTPQAQVDAQILQDLKEAQSLLPDNTYLSGTGAATIERVHPNKQAVNALLARFYLYHQNWQDAEAVATSIINSSAYTLEPLANIFLKTSREAIWQLSPGAPGLNNADAQSLVIVGRPTLSMLNLNNNLLNAFEPGDARLLNWVGTSFAPAVGSLPAATYKFAYKYKAYLVSDAIPVTEYAVMMRLAEQYLIRAEARAYLGNISGAQSDLNRIRNRASLPNTTAAAKDDLLNAIAHERQIELFTEMGHRWFDLRRTGKLDAVMNVVAPQKGGTWSTYKQLLPVPSSEIVLNRNLVQNPGY